MAGAREGDWRCAGCSNLNYAFRSLCNRCKQPRLLVDMDASPHSKWLPRFGDWICAGCSNNNYASRYKCNKCGEPKQVAFPTGMVMPVAWNLAAASVGEHKTDRRPGDWSCSCGFLNYASRTACKRCQASPMVAAPYPLLKRQASEELAADWAIKRPHVSLLQQPPMPTLAWDDTRNLVFNIDAVVLPPPAPAGVQGGKHWRDGDWLCAACGNHNYASRGSCNRCGRQKEP